MVTGAANAEAALLLIDAHEGVQENSRRHGYLLNLLGIRQIAVLVNKMDLENYSEARFNQIETEYRAWLNSIGVEPKVFIPIAAKHGDNIAIAQHEHALVERPDRARDARRVQGHRPARRTSRCASRFRTFIASTTAASSPAASKRARIKVGDRLVFSPTNKTSTVKTIERWNAPPTRLPPSAGESIGITLTEQIFVERGAVAALETAPPYELTRFKARVFWLGKTAFQPRARNTSSSSPRRKWNARSSRSRRSSTPPRSQPSPAATDELFVGRHEVGRTDAPHTKKPVAFDAHQRDRAAPGRFVIVDGFDVAGGGIIADGQLPAAHRTTRSTRATTSYWSHGKVTAAAARAAQRPSPAASSG